MTKLLTTQNAKTVKGEALGYMTAIQSLEPSNGSGFNVCKYSGQCASECLNTAGRNHMTMQKQARINRTLLFFLDRKQYELELVSEIFALIAKANKEQQILAIRPNGLADLPYEKIRLKEFNGQTIFSMFPNVQFYDYTKYPYHERPTEKLPSNYHLTYSVSEKTTRDELETNMRNGRNCAVVFRLVNTQELPKEYLGYEVINGDETDLRFLDKPNVIIGLTAKGKAKKNESDFTVTI